MAGLGKEGFARIYKDFLRVCEQWPVDKSRAGRDFGEHVRISIGPRFKEQTIDHNEAKRTVDALTKISTNYYRNMYPRVNEIGYTTQEEKIYQKILSNEVQAQVKPHRTWWERLSGSKKLAERMRDKNDAK